MTAYIFVAGYGNSLGEHWQQHWFRRLPNSYWVEQTNWDIPEQEAWISALKSCIDKLDQPIMFVCHSLGCLTVVEWAKRYSTKVLGALMVAVPDPKSVQFPANIIGFQDVPLRALPFPTKIIASENDPYCKKDKVLFFANHWNSEISFLADAGHINVSAGFGAWPQGFEELIKWEQLLKSTKEPSVV